MQDQEGHERFRRKIPRPLDRARLDELALAYVARFATSEAKLATYLARKLRERGWDEEQGAVPDLAGVARRYAEMGYVDDEAYALAKSGGLLRRGYGPRRVSQALRAAGIGDAPRDAALPSEAGARRAALTMARKRRFGPFGAEPLDRAKREKQIAAMIRAGHGLDNAREMVDAESVETAEQWANAASEHRES